MIITDGNIETMEYTKISLLHRSYIIMLNLTKHLDNSMLINGS